MTDSTYNILSILIQAVTLCIIFWAATSALKQFRAARHNTWSQGFKYCSEILQDNETVKSRGKAFELAEKNKPYDQYTKEDKEVLDQVCRAYDLIGMMAQWGMVPKEIIIDSWCDSIRRLWPICEPRVKERRIKQKADEFWDDFEWLYNAAKEFDTNRMHQMKKVRSLQSID